MALAVGLRSNRLLRCLDLSIPLNDEDVASLSQDILQVSFPVSSLRFQEVERVVPDSRNVFFSSSSRAASGSLIFFFSTRPRLVSIRNPS